MSAPAAASEHVDQFVDEHPTLVRIGRAGWFAKGVVYVLVGVLAFIVARQGHGWTPPTSGTTEASPTGAIRAVAGSPGGPVLLGVLALGLLLYALWRLVMAVLPGDRGATSWAKRIGYAISAIIYSTFAVTSITLAVQHRAKTDGNRTVVELTGSVMSHLAGRWLIAIVGLVVIGAGVYHVVNGLRRSATDDVDMAGLAPWRRTAVRVTGSAGEAGRGIGIALVGIFLVRAAWTYDPQQATGLDGALRRASSSTFGTVMVLVVAVGFLAYGVFCLLSFDHQRLDGP